MTPGLPSVNAEPEGVRVGGRGGGEPPRAGANHTSGRIRDMWTCSSLFHRFARSDGGRVEEETRVSRKERKAHASCHNLHDRPLVPSWPNENSCAGARFVVGVEHAPGSGKDSQARWRLRSQARWPTLRATYAGAKDRPGTYFPPKVWAGGWYKSKRGTSRLVIVAVSAGFRPYCYVERASSQRMLALYPSAPASRPAYRRSGEPWRVHLSRSGRDHSA